MKLHLPKALFTAVMAVFAMAQTSYAETYDLLADTDSWNGGFSYQGWGGPQVSTYNTEEYGCYIYTVDENKELSFSLSYTLSGGPAYNNSVQTFAFVDSDLAIVLGTDYFKIPDTDGGVPQSYIGYGTSTAVDARAYGISSGFTPVELEQFEEGRVNTQAETTYTMNGKVTFNEESQTYKMVVTLSYGDVSYQSNVVDLGNTVDINRFVFGSEGANRTLNSLSITGSYVLDRYDATVSGELSASDASWLYNNGASSASPDMTNGTANVGLTGAGEGASIVFADGASLKGIFVMADSVGLKSGGSMTADSLLVKDGASATIATELTASNVSGAVTIADGGKLTTGNVSGTLSIAKDGELAYTGSNIGFLTTTTGTGTISITTETRHNENLSSSFAGIIDVAAGTKLYLGDNEEDVFSLSDATIKLNGGSRLEMKGKNSTLGGLDVVADSTIYFEDGKTNEALLTIGEVRIAAEKKLTMGSTWEGNVTISNLNAEGDLDLQTYAAWTGQRNLVVLIENAEATGAINSINKLVLGKDANSVLNLGGNVTNSDAAAVLTIKGQLAGESTISGGTINVESTASVTGDITFGTDISLAGTLQNSGSLTLGGDVSVSGVAGLTAVENAAVTYSTNDGKDGYIASAQYYVVQGTGSATSSLTGTSVLTSGGVELGTITQSADGKSLVADVALDAPGGIWHVNTQDFTIDGEETNLAKDATGYKVAAGKTLTIASNQNDTMTAAKIFKETTGAGNIKLTTDVAMSGAAQATGKLTVSGATLTVNLGNNTAGRDTDHSYLTSFDSIDLNNATILYHGSNTTMNNVTVGADGATLRIKDMGADRVVTLGKTTTLTGDFTIESRGWDGTPDGLKSWKYAVNIEALTGAGGLIVKGNNSSQGETNKVTVGLLDTYTGTITVERPTSGTTTLIATADGDINLSGLNVSGGANVDLSGVAGTKNLGAVSVGANTTLALQGTIGDMDATGDGSISLADGTVFTGTASIANATTLAGTISNSGSLTLTGALSASSLDVFDAAGENATSYANGDVEGNGYLSTALTIVESAADSSQLTASGSGLTLTVGGVSYDLSQSGNDLQLVIDGNGGNYYVANTQDYTAGSKIASAATTGIVMNGGTLNLNTALADGISISTAAAGSVINVADGVTLANSSVTAGSTKVTVTGGSTAIYDMGSGWTVDNMADTGFGANVNFGDGWNGTTVLTNVHIGKSILDRFTKEGGTLKLVGYSGWMSFDGSDATVNSNLVLENYANTVDGVTTTKSAFVFDDNSQGKKYNFNGDISGSGDFQIASQAGSSATITFAGDTAEWKGGIVVTNAYNSTGDGKNRTNTVDVNLTSGGDIFSAEGNKGIVMDRASTNDGNNIINLNIGNANTDSTMNGAISMGDNADDRSQLKLTVKGDTTFKKEVEVTSLTVDANKTATLEAATTTDGLTTNGTIKVTGNGSLTYGGTTTVWAPYTGYNTEAAAATITSDAITGGSVTFNNAEDVTESRVISDAGISKYGAGTANVTVGDANALVWVEEGNLAMTAANGSTSLAEMAIAAGSQVSTTGNLTVTDALTIIGDAATPALSVTGALTLAGAEINLTNLTLQEGVTSYTLGTAEGGIDTTGVSLKFGADQLAVAGFEGYTATVGASATDATALVLTLTAPEQPGEPDPGLTTLTEITITGGTYADNVLTFTTTADLTNTVFGETLNAIMSDDVWASIVGATTLPDEVLVSFKDAAGELIDFDGDGTAQVPTITINGEGTKGAQELTGNGTIVGGYVTSYIPEPTTTTLSLLALAGLAVRRRRK